MKVIDKEITNPKVKSLLTNMFIYGYSMMPTGDIKTIWEAYKVFAKDYPAVIFSFWAFHNAKIQKIDIDKEIKRCFLSK